MKPMLAQLVRDLPIDGYVYEPKWDGFRCLAARDGPSVELWSRHERPLGRYFPELVSAFGSLAPDRFTIDGEILVTVGGRFDFEALMRRLHPARTRVHELARETPAIFVAFDLPAVDGEDLREAPFAQRRGRLAAVLADADPPLFVTPATEDPQLARRWLEQFCGAGLDGVVAKHRELRYESGRRGMLKVKHERTADCVVAGLRANEDADQVTSLLLGLHDEAGELEHVGVVSSFSRERRAALAQELAPLVTSLQGHPWERGFLVAGGSMGRLKGAAGRWVPGMTLDWIPLRAERVVEVAYTQVDGYRLRHPAKFVRWRPDRDPASCRTEQLHADSPLPAQVLSA